MTKRQSAKPMFSRDEGESPLPGMSSTRRTVESSPMAPIGTLQNTFDGDGARIIRVANGTTTHYVGDRYEVNPTTGVATCSYPFNGQAIAVKQGSSLFYLHRDQGGSVVSISDASAKEVASLRFAPFGNLRTLTFANGYSALPTDRLFTGQTRDLGDDRFYFFKARYYDATIGKFQVPDSIVPQAKDPQTLNRYAYGLNSPLKYVDPSGHFVMFIGGYGTDQDWDRSQFRDEIAKLQAAGMKGGRDYGFFDWSKGTPLGFLGQSINSMIRSVGDAAASLAEQIQGKTNITLIGHSKGGDVVLEYLAEVAEGKLQVNTQLHAAVTLNAPVDDAFASAANAYVSRDRLINLPDRLNPKGVHAKIYSLYNPNDRVNAALNIRGIDSRSHASGTDDPRPDWAFWQSDSNHLATLADPYTDSLISEAMS